MSIDHYENFPVASFLCPPALRPAVASIYWFARTADDIADEGDAPPETRLAELAAYRDSLGVAAETSEPAAGRWASVFGPLRVTLSCNALPLNLLTDLLSAFEQDVVQTTYASRAELLDYCRRSANPVGRLLLHLYGVNSAQALRQSDAICTALQLANFWQDLSVDTARGRLYLPAADCERRGIDPGVLMARVDSPAVRALVAEMVEWARSLMRAGAPLVYAVPGRAGWELRLVVQGGMRILDKIEADGFTSLRHRPTLRWHDAVVMLWRALWMRPPRRVALGSAHDA